MESVGPQSQLQPDAHMPNLPDDPSRRKQTTNKGFEEEYQTFDGLPAHRRCPQHSGIVFNPVCPELNLAVKPVVTPQSKVDTKQLAPELGHIHKSVCRKRRIPFHIIYQQERHTER